MTLGHETMVVRKLYRERERALRSRRVKSRQVAIQEDQAGVLGLQRLHLKYYMKRALKRLMNPEPYYRYPRI